MSTVASMGTVTTFAAVKVGDQVGTMGYVVAITAEGLYITLALRSKPLSPTGLLRGVSRRDFTGHPAEKIEIGDYV